MPRKLEYFLYAAVILTVIFRYSGAPEGGSDIGSGIRSTIPPKGGLPSDLAQSVVVQIDKRSQSGVGTAFSVEGDGTYVTARHVVEGCHNVSLVVDGRQYGLQSVSRTMNRDFSILKAESLKGAPFELSSRRPKRGEAGFMMGYPQGNPADVQAVAIGRTEMRTQGRYRAKEPVVAWVERERKPGFRGALGGISGGPVFDENGLIVGTVVAGAPRRGRVYTTDPKVFSETNLLNSGTADIPSDQITPQNYSDIGDRYRSRARIAQVYCRVT